MNAGEAWGWYGRSLLATIVGVGVHQIVRRNWSQMLQGVLVLYGFLWFFYQSMYATGDQTLWSGFGVIFILVLANLIKMVPSIATAVVIHRLKSERWQYIYRVLFVVPMIVPAMVGLLVWKSFFDPTQGILNRVLVGSGLLDVLVWIDELLGWDVFHLGSSPSWLGDASLVIPSLIFWGFPWVGTVGVLIYLTGLAGIDDSVYEASEIAGASSRCLEIALQYVSEREQFGRTLSRFQAIQHHLAVMAGEIATVESMSANAFYALDRHGIGTGRRDAGFEIAAAKCRASDAVEAIATIGETIRSVDDISSSIAAAVEEQGASTREIAQSIQQVAAGTQEVNASIGSVSRAASETGAVTNEVLSSAQQLTDEADRLRASVDAFLSDIKAA